MIRVIITGQSRKGKFPYRVAGRRCVSGPMDGLSADPLQEVCRRLRRMGEAPNAIVGLFSGNECQSKSTVEGGSK